MGEAIRVIQVVRPAEGGMRNHVIELVRRLPRRLCETMVVGPLDRFTRGELSRRHVPWANLPVPGRVRVKELRVAARTLRRLLASKHPAIVHAHGYMAGLSVALGLRGLASRPKLLLTAHVLPQYRSGLLGMARRIGYRLLLSRCDHIIAVSEAVHRAIAACAPAMAQNCTVIHNGIDPTAYQPRLDIGVKKREIGVRPEAATVGVVARLSPEKGVEVFLRAASMLALELPNVEFLIVGDGPERERLEALAHELRIGGQTIFAGERHDIPHILATLDLLVVPSLQEAFGLAALEGLAARLPVVMSKVGGMEEAFRGAEDVLFVPPGDPKALQEAMRTVLTTLPEEDDGQGPLVELVAGGMLPLKSMLVSETEFDLDRVGLERRAQRPQTEHQGTVNGRHAILDRFHIQRTVEATFALYQRLARAGTAPAGAS